MDLNFFALSTPIGKEIEKATSEDLAAEDWALNLNIMDMINQEDNGPYDAIRAIKKRLANSNQRVVQLTLTVLETCVKNCGLRFQEYLGKRDFVDRFVSVASQKSASGEQARRMLAEWTEAFAGLSIDLTALYNAFESLKADGLVFPTVDSTKAAPINLPAMTATSPGQPMGKTKLTERERAKLRSELKIVDDNVDVLGDMIGSLQEGQKPNQRMEALYATTKEMQRRLLTLIDHVDDTDVMSALLAANDRIVNVFALYTAAPEPSQVTPGLSTATPILTNEEEQLAQQMAELDVSDDQSDDKETSAIETSSHPEVSSEDFNNFLNTKQ